MASIGLMTETDRNCCYQIKVAVFGNFYINLIVVTMA